MATSGEAADAWILRVLGVRPPSAANETSAGASAIVQAIADWDDAQDRVNIQIAKLQQVLLASPDSGLHDIAEFGLNAVTGNHRTKLLAALMVFRGGGQADPTAAGKAAKLVESFLAHIGGDARIAACDANPFGVRVTLHQTMMPALQGLKAALQAPTPG